MSNRTWLAALGLLVMVTAPVASHARGGERALDACVKSFVDTYLPNRIVHVRKRFWDPSPLTMRKNAYTVVLTARGTKSGRQIAQARCVANVRGDVLVLDNLSPQDYMASADFTVDLR